VHEIELDPTAHEHCVVVGYNDDEGGYYLRVYDRMKREWNTRIHDMMDALMDAGQMDDITFSQMMGAVVDAKVDDTAETFGYVGLDRMIGMLMLIVDDLPDETITMIIAAQETRQ